MKSTYNYSKRFCLIPVITVSLFIASCKKFVEIPTAPDLLTSAEVFSDSADATSALAGIYASMVTSKNTYSGSIPLYTGLSADELYVISGTIYDKEFYTNALLPTNNFLGVFWSTPYTFMYRVNALIEGVTASTGISSSAKSQLTGEAKVLRALYYFYLVNTYGPVPLITSTDYKENAQIGRTSVDLVYTQIIDDLVSAQELLMDDYPSEGRSRPNRYAATALLARVYLYRQQWEKAESEATKLIESGGKYDLVPLNNVFLSTVVTPSNTEAIWQIAPVRPGVATFEGFTFIPATTTVMPAYGVSNYLLDAFEIGDARKTSWLNFNTVNNQPYYYPYKYKLGRDNNFPSSESYMVLRLGEQYLIRAEARVKQDKLTEAAADIDMIRNRAGLSNTTAGTQDELLAAVYHERQVELFCEWGHRWYDMKRTGLADQVMGAGGVCQAKGGAWNANKQLYPIFQGDLNNNFLLVQNPGY